MSDDGASDVLGFPTQAEFESWLEHHHARGPGIWLRIAKKGASVSSVTYAEATDAALCFGWIDGQKRRGDDEHWLQRFTPRSAGSRWSQINRAKAERLIIGGRMRPSGLAEVDRARNDGRWDAAYAGQSTATVPDDLQAALDADPLLASAFAQLSARDRFSMIWRLNDAKRAETRARRLTKYLDQLRHAGRLHD